MPSGSDSPNPSDVSSFSVSKRNSLLIFLKQDTETSTLKHSASLQNLVNCFKVPVVRRFKWTKIGLSYASDGPFSIASSKTCFSSNHTEIAQRMERQADLWSLDGQEITSVSLLNSNFWGLCWLRTQAPCSPAFEASQLPNSIKAAWLTRC